MADASKRRSAAGISEMGRDCLAVRVRLLSRTISRTYDAALRPHGMTIAQLNMLSVVRTLQPVASGAVAEVLSMEISTLSRNARLMEQEGWVAIEPAARGNGRVLSLTTAGEAKLAEVTPAWREAQKQAREMLGADGAQLLTSMVDGLWAQHFSAT